ncbi:cytochrome P450 [Infundibulicybe gibba]|nr:cytochrome P450 [Infundibulicybe gibba]
MELFEFCALSGLLVIAYAIPSLVRAYRDKSKLSPIPVIGPSGILSSYWVALRFVREARTIVQEGYDKYYGRAFRVPTLSKWVIVVSGPDMLDDIRRAPDDQLSFREAISETFHIDYTMGPEIHHDPYHVATVRTPLTRNLAIRFTDIQEEIAAAFNDVVPVNGKEWVSVPAFRTMMRVVSRTSNRLFVGFPLCRDVGYLSMMERFARDVFSDSNTLNCFPRFLWPIAARLFTDIAARTKTAIGYLGPIVQDRLDKEEQYGFDWPGKPNDLISWLLEEAQGDQRSVWNVTARVLAVNFAAIHTTSMASTHMLYDLSVRPEYIQPLREEVESVVTQEGLSKASLGKMRKLDSFVRESQRFTGTGACITPLLYFRYRRLTHACTVVMGRKVLRDFTFSNGTFVPAGNFITVASFATHHDEINYESPQEFDGFRFSKMREADGESIRHQMVSLSSKNVMFGSGRHACPGRFFAVNELKAILAHVLLKYDVKLEDDSGRPADHWLGAAAIPNPYAKVMFRQRTL